MNLPTTGIPKLDQYCAGVKSGDIVVCKWVKLAVDRHYRDLKKWGVNHYEPKTGEFDEPLKGEYYFDPSAALYYADFFESELRHFDGVFSGKPFLFEPWQWFTFASPFGWLKAERIEGMSIRRFSELNIFIPKKQGKSLWIAGTMLFMLEKDEYPGAQNYALAVNQSHAKRLGYRDAETLVKESPTLSKKFKVNK